MILFNKKEDKKVLLTDFIYLFVSKSKRANDYKRRYRNVAKHIANFQTRTGIVMYADSVTENIAEEFIAYLRSDNVRNYGKNKNGLMASTVDDLWTRVCHMLKKAHEYGHKVDFGYKNVKTEGEDSNAVYLTLDELNKINELKNLSTEAKAVRDRFLVGCFTALRLSDYSKLTSKNIVGGNIVIKTRKTGANVVIPIHPIVQQVLERNKGEFPPLPSPQSFGATIKRVCRKAGINTDILYERTIGTKIVRKRVKKYTLVSSHTARRTGATNMYLAGIPTFRIMLLTGHTTEQSFFRYIRIEKEENAKTLSEHPFFKN